MGSAKAQAAADAFEFRCYDAVQRSGKPTTAAEVAVLIGRPVFGDLEVRKALLRLFKRKAISRTKKGGVLHYYI